MKPADEATNLAADETPAGGIAADRVLLSPSGRPFRVLIVEEHLRDLDGHYAGFVGGLAAWLAARGVEVEIWAHRAVDPRVGPPGVPLRPVFRETWSEGLFRGTRWHRRAWVLTHNLHYFQTLRRAGGGRGWDLVLATDVNFFHLLAWRAWLAWAPDHTRLALLTIQTPWLQEAGAGGEPGFARPAWIYRQMWRMFAGAVTEHRCRLAADTGGHARRFTRIAGVPFVEVPIARADSLLARIGVPPPTTDGIRLGFLGRPSAEKGGLRLVDAIESWIRRPAAGRPRVRFVVQTMEVPGATDASGRRLRELARAAPEAVEIVEGCISEPRYAELLASLHGMVLPYARGSYATRGSSLAMDALCCGRPFICTAGTWTAERMDACGAGVTCDEAPASIVGAIDEFVRRYDELAARAQGRIPAAREYFSWPRLFRQLDLVPDGFVRAEPPRAI